MNNKILVIVYVPTLESSYDVLIPANKNIGHAIVDVENLISVISDGYFALKGNRIFIDMISGKQYDNSKTFDEENILNGTEIILL